MADCNDDCEALTTGILKGCDNNKAGIKKLWLTELCNLASATVSSPGGYREFTMNGSTEFYKFEFNKRTSTANEDRIFNEENGSEFYLKSIVLKLNRREKTKTAVLSLLGHFKELVAIYQDSNDLYWMVGENDGLVLKTMPSPTGTAPDDHNGYVLTFEANENDPAMELTEAFIVARVAAGDIDFF